MAQLQLPRIDLSGLREKHTGTPEWEAARAQVLQALRSYGCFEVIYDGFTQQLREAVFGAAAREVISLPAETKSRSPGYSSFGAFKALDSVAMLDATPEGIQSFPNLMWPQGNAWTNGRLQSVHHRVVLSGDETRYSTIFGASPKEGYVVQAPEELVDQHHPALFKPFEYADYFRYFLASKAALKAEDVLKAYCGFQGDQMEEEA
ncbi:probable 2-oxoglutarate-dependent dioxygenase AOP1.2 [Phoenix dactylifera]|uniref:Probable 2-oxoglutarate-dependent dioxygenase AOP1.2 n=1 Tax=Phoenix dactylifera TaxID=42345 RepID=A0A8B9AVY4_PHODC|nr:probable 2-oxoglutarate-dependent dioxygenase AOP1.2 [Phoenix dactylifera]